MNESEVVAILADLGWRCEKDEVGDRFCVIGMGDRFIHVMPTISVREDHLRLSMMPSVSTESFTSAVKEIYEDEIGSCPILARKERPEKLVNITAGDIARISNEIKIWGAGQDVDAGLEVYRNLPTNAKGARPLWHLAALALSGSSECLAAYKASFAAGDRLDFVPYITPEMIDRALSIAEKHPI